MSPIWIGLLRAALVVLIIVGVVVIAYVQFLIPPVVLFIILFGVSLYLMTREGRARRTGVIMGGVAALLFVLGNLGIIIEDLAHPDSVLSFATSGAGIIGAVVGFVAMLGALLRWPERPVRPLQIVAGLGIVAFIAIGLVATLGAESDEREEGDVVLVAEDVDYFAEGTDPESDEDAEITVERGGAVFVDNKDLYRHTFVVESLGIEEEVPAAKDVRVVIDAEPGDYEFICDVSGHDEDMRGTLTVR